ncbi:MAG: hypothetical protein B0D92_06245 [Spirochaeta sp. LUC14_002_19_P3]|nr:MAG: hypothetical protein B0D92_06245 [Spirochaeta sp. LUC14_002_19_P3]
MKIKLNCTGWKSFPVYRYLACLTGIVLLILGACEAPTNPTYTLSFAVNGGVIPSDLSSYDQLAQDVFSGYTAGATLVARYATADGTGDGSSWDNAGTFADVMAGITDAAADKVYIVLVASGTYTHTASFAMKNNIAIVGGFTAGSFSRGTDATRFDGENTRIVFNNANLDNSALLYGVTITKGNAGASDGGGMRNSSSSPILKNVTISGNSSTYGGGMYNASSSPILNNVTISGNSSTYGGGMYNASSSSPILNNVTISGNRGTSDGGGMYNASSSPILNNVTLSGNTATSYGGGMYNQSSSSPILNNVTLSDNTATSGGGSGIYLDNATVTLVNSIVWDNSDAGNIYVYDDSNNFETINLYNSILEGGTTASTNATGIKLANGSPASALTVNTSTTINTNPNLVALADNGGSVQTMAILAGSSAADIGLYIRQKGTTFYYSSDASSWFSDLALSTAATLPADASNPIATDARGTARSTKPDAGAFEVQ